MNYIIPSLCAVAWVIFCILLLLLPSRPFEMALMATALMILHKDSANNLRGRADVTETEIVQVLDREDGALP